MAEMLLVNPRRRRRRASTKKRRTRARTRVVYANPTRPKRRRRRSGARRSRIGRVTRRTRSGRSFVTSRGFINQTLLPAGVGAAGALGVDIAMGMLPVPDALRSGPLAPFVRLAAAVGIGFIATQVTNRRTGEAVAAGAVTVVMYDVIKGFVRQMAPNLPMAGMDNEYAALDYINAGLPVGEYVGSSNGTVMPMGEYVGY